MLYALSALAVPLLIGGGTHPDNLNEIMLQLAAVASVVLLLARSDAPSPAVLVLGLLALFFVAVAQAVLVRVPADLAALAGGHAAAPHRAAVALLSLLPALVVFHVTANGTTGERRAIVSIILVAVAFNLALGLLQMAQGPASRLRFFAETNSTEAVGLFANRNHYAALLYCGLCLCAGLFLARLGKLDGKDNSLRGVQVAGLAVFVTALLVGVVASRSRMAVLLTMAAVLGTAIVVAISLARRGASVRSIASLAIGGFGVLMAVQLGMAAVAARFGHDPLSDDRVGMAATTSELIGTLLPFGAGLGAFETIYNAAENRLDLGIAYAHRAHNDWLEYVLETGALGMVVAIAFVAWFIVAAGRAWFSRNDALDEMARPASIAIVLLLLHSLVDYPLRTTAIQVVFAACCALLLRPRHEMPPARPSRADIVVNAHVPAPSMSPRRPWEGSANWPTDWR